MGEIHEDLRHDPIPTCDCHACALHERNLLRTQLGDLADGDAVRDAAWFYDRQERDRLRAQLAAAQEDAERYRCLKEHVQWMRVDTNGDVHLVLRDGSGLMARGFDAAIDAARKEVST